MDTFFLFKADACCPLSLAINSQWQYAREKKKEEGREKKKRKGGGEKKEKKRERISCITIHVFLLFLRASKILILIKNNLKNTKNILTVRSNSV